MLRPPPVPEQVLASAKQRMIRARLLQAVASIAVEQGAHRVGIDAISRQASVAPHVLRTHYESAQDCLSAAYQAALDEATSRLLPAYRQAEEWSQAISNGLAALLRFADEQPVFARLLIVEGQHAPRPISRKRADAIRLMVRAVDDGRLHSPHPQGLSPLTAEAILMGVIGVIAERLQTGARTPMISLHARLQSMILLAYQGAEPATGALRRKQAGTRTVAKPASSPAGGRAATTASKPTANTGRRNAARNDSGKLVLTARTAMVLGVLAEHPGATNRQVQIAAGIATGGEASKLLNRLQRQGVIINTGRQGRGGRNAWHLTEKAAWAGQAA